MYFIYHKTDNVELPILLNKFNYQKILDYYFMNIIPYIHYNLKFLIKTKNQNFYNYIKEELDNNKIFLIK